MGAHVEKQSSALRNKKEKTMSYLTTKNQYITVQGNQIAYRELSKGKSKLPLLMLVHLAATLDNWDPKLLDLIAEKHHVIVVDLPGVGASQGKVAATIPGMADQTIDFRSFYGRYDCSRNHPNKSYSSEPFDFGWNRTSRWKRGR